MGSFFKSPSLDGTLPESVIPQENNFLLNLHINFQNVYFFLGIDSPVEQVQS